VQAEHDEEDGEQGRNGRRGPLDDRQAGHVEQVDRVVVRRLPSIASNCCSARLVRSPSIWTPSRGADCSRHWC
jgi:hypothetical protein